MIGAVKRTNANGPGVPVDVGGTLIGNLLEQTLSPIAASMVPRAKFTGMMPSPIPQLAVRPRVPLSVNPQVGVGR